MTQQTLNRIAQKQRLKFNVFYKMYENLLGNFLGNFTALKTAAYGSRSMSRILTGGHTFTHLVTDGFMRPLQDALHKVPGVEEATNLCIKLLENNFTAGRKVDQ